MSKYSIALIPGDGIGTEVVDATMPAFDKLAAKHGIEFDFKSYPFGGDHYISTGEVLSDESMVELKKHDALYLGAVGSPKVKPGILEKGILLKLRFEFDQYINLRPVKLYPGVETPIKGKTAEDLDYVVVRENTGGLYTGVGGGTMVGTEFEAVSQSMVYTHKQVERCLRYAFEVAMTRDRKKLCMIGKTNVLTHVFGLWERVYDQLKEEYPSVEATYMHVDAACMHMVTNPAQFDVMVTTNMFGDIITDLGAVTQGGMGMAALANINPEKTTPSMFEPVHGSAPDIAGQDKANPLATFMSAKMMLDFLGETEAAAELDAAICAVSEAGFEGLGTKEIGQLVVDKL